MRKIQSIASLGVRAAAAGILVTMVPGCSSGNETAGPTTAPVPPPVTTPSPTTTPVPGKSTSGASTEPKVSQPPSAPPTPEALSAAQQQLAGLSLEQRVGQLFMIAAKATGAEPGTMEALTKYHAGNVYLSGRSKAGTAATAAVVASLTGSFRRNYRWAPSLRGHGPGRWIRPGPGRSGFLHHPCRIGASRSWSREASGRCHSLGEGTP